jgi:hypothetical protein
MFRKPISKKRPAKPTLLRTVAVDDDDEQDVAIRSTSVVDDGANVLLDVDDGSTSYAAILLKKRQKHRKLSSNSRPSSAGLANAPGGGARPILHLADPLDGEEEEDVDVRPIKKDGDGRRRPRRRLGYGGGPALDADEVGSGGVGYLPPYDDDGANGGGEAGSAAAGGGAFVSYDRASLSRLHAEQGRYVAPPPPAAEEDPNLLGELPPESPFPSVSLKDPSQPLLRHHLWGDDPYVVSAAATTAHDSNIEGSQGNNLGGGGIRAVDGPFAVVPPAVGAEPPYASETVTTVHQQKVVSLQQIRDGLVATLASTSQRREEVLAPQLRRVQVQHQEARDEADRHEALVQRSGRALEYYQSLRQRIATWVGAMRELQGKIVPVQAGLHELLAEMNCHQRRRDWQTDMVAVLFRHDRLDRVLGRQIDDPQTMFDPLQTDIVTVDEFGRSVQSQTAIQREHRRRRRQKIREQRMLNDLPVRGDESDAYLTDEERESFRERHDALLRALDVVMQELDDEFTSLQNLVNLFAEWKEQYPEDYQQCYASLSLADLASVLILAELCALNDPWNESGGYNEGKWIAVIKDALDRGLLDEAGFERMLEKSVSPSVADLLHRSGYAIMSSRQSAALSSFLHHVAKVEPPNGSASLAKRKRQIQEYIALSLLDVSIPVVRKAPQNAQVSVELEEVLQGATVGQMHSLQKLLLNIITNWGPILGTDDAFVEAVLDFISSKFLFLLSSLQQDAAASRFSESPVDVFREVWDALVPTGWLTDPKWMLQTVAIRAAYTAFTARSVVVDPSS